MIKFSVARLEKEPIELIGDEPPEWLDIPPAELLDVTSPIHYDLLVRAVNGGILVEGKVRTRITGSCGRCLEPISREIENAEINLFYEMPDEEELDISEDIRAEMVVELPMNLLCTEECLGLCPHCGVNLNRGDCNCHSEDDGSDSRWGALDDLKL